MPITDYVLYRLARRWPSPMQHLTDRLGAEPGSDEYSRAYAWEQFDSRVRKGIGISVRDQDVLEIGCGHGGICCFLAAVGARSVVGIDLNTRHLNFARELAAEMAMRWGRDAELPITFTEMNAYALTFAPESFDVVFSDNAFEHFIEPEQVMREAFRVLRPGGMLYVPVFSSILSKYGLHLKHGLKLPWANLFFSEPTIIRALRRMARENPAIFDLYPGLSEDPKRVRDLRRYKDLNDITYRSFREMAGRVGYVVERFKPHLTPVGRVLSRTPGLKKSRLADIFSTGASAVLRKPATTVGKVDSVSSIAQAV